MIVMMLLAVRSDVMGQFVIGAKLKMLGWLATLMMAAAVAAMLLTI
jgi:Mn2+/Fe2+ NRAMP family transporter